MASFEFTSENINGTQLFYLEASQAASSYWLYFKIFPNWPSEEGWAGAYTSDIYVNGKTEFTYSVIPYAPQHMRLCSGSVTFVGGWGKSLSGVPYDFDVYVGEVVDPPPKVINPTPVDAERRVSRHLNELTWELP